MTRRLPISLVEITVAMLILLLGLGVFTSGYFRSRKAVDFRQSVHRIEELCLQANRFSRLTGRQGRVVLRREKERWIGYISLIGSVSGGNSIRELTKRWGIEQIDSIKIGNSLLSEIQLLFYSRRGLYSIEAKDGYEKKLSFSDLGVDIQKLDDKITGLEMVIAPKATSLAPLTIDLKPFITTVHTYASLPDDPEKAE